MLYIVLFEDNVEAAAEARRTHMQAHLNFLETHASQVKSAGPLREVAGDPAGGLWLVEAANASEVDRLVKEDPFWPTGMRKSVRILEWRQVFADGRRLI